MFRLWLLLTLAVASAFAQTQGTQPRFSAASVRRSGLSTNPYTFVSGGVLRGERYDLRKATALDLIHIAYDLDPDAVLGGPDWLEFDRFDVAGKAPAGTAPQTVRLMLQTLLSERFKLSLRQETKPMPAFVLKSGKDHPKLREASGDTTADCKWMAGPAGSLFTAYACRRMTMSAFAQRLRAMAGDYLLDPVVDATGLEGEWDFELSWNGRSRVIPAGVGRMTIFDAVAKQLGLSLGLAEIPAPVIVIDHIEKPAPDPPGIERQLPPRDLTFEVADLKPSRPGEPGRGMNVTKGGGLEARAMDMRVLLATAWDIDWDHLERFAGMPKWAESAKFDINAKAATNTTGPPVMGSGYIDDDVRLMLRALLVERFGITWHYEDRPMDAWTLTATKPKMKKAESGSRASCKPARAVANDPRDQNPLVSELLTCRNATLAQFASQLQPFEPDNFAYPVEDATGLTGRWDFSLSFSPPWLLQPPAPSLQASGATPAASEPNGAISLEQAISRQLGLKLEKRKRMLPVVVIDHIEEHPIAN